MAGFLQYFACALRRAEYEQLPSGEWYAHIPGFAGLWANGATVEDTRDDLQTALDEWLLINVFVAKRELPPIEGFDLTPKLISTE
jgi:predicted RNase H-like HicB family nuclease